MKIKNYSTWDKFFRLNRRNAYLIRNSTRNFYGFHNKRNRMIVRAERMEG